MKKIFLCVVFLSNLNLIFCQDKVVENIDYQEIVDNIDLFKFYNKVKENEKTNFVRQFWINRLLKENNYKDLNKVCFSNFYNEQIIEKLEYGNLKTGVNKKANKIFNEYNSLAKMDEFFDSFSSENEDTKMKIFKEYGISEEEISSPYPYFTVEEIIKDFYITNEDSGSSYLDNNYYLKIKNGEDIFFRQINLNDLFHYSKTKIEKKLNIKFNESFMTSSNEFINYQWTNINGVKYYVKSYYIDGNHKNPDECYGCGSGRQLYISYSFETNEFYYVYFGNSNSDPEELELADVSDKENFIENAEIIFKKQDVWKLVN